MNSKDRAFDSTVFSTRVFSDSNGKIVFPTCFTERPSNLKSFLSEHLLLKNLSYNYLCFVSFFIRFSMSICLCLTKGKALVGPSLDYRRQAYALVACSLRLAALVGPSGLEPPTSCLSGTRSNQLSYEPMLFFWQFPLGSTISHRWWR